jgi:hypothetical protein
MRRGWLLLFGLVYLSTGTAASQSVRGTVFDRSTNETLAGAVVVLLDSDERISAAEMTDANGAFTLRAPAPGTYRLRAQLIGYTTAESGALAVIDEDTLFLEIRLRPVALELDAFTVTAVRNENLAGFLKRQESGVGQYLGPEQIAQRPSLHTDEYLWGIGGFNVITDMGVRSLVLSSRGQVCTPTVYVDRVRIPPWDTELNLDLYVRAEQVRAIEVYRDDVWAPAPFTPPPLTNCAVIVIWSRMAFGE